MESCPFFRELSFLESITSRTENVLGALQNRLKGARNVNAQSKIVYLKRSSRGEVIKAFRKGSGQMYSLKHWASNKWSAKAVAAATAIKTFVIISRRNLIPSAGHSQNDKNRCKKKFPMLFWVCPEACLPRPQKLRGSLYVISPATLNFSLGVRKCMTL